jgi:hypothetical protein
MEGLTASRQLATRSATHFVVATEAHEAGIRRLLREVPLPGPVDITFEREPNYFAGSSIAGGLDETIVAIREQAVVCVGRCVRRRCALNGRPAQIGYLAELRLDPSATGEFRIVRDGYRFFGELQRQREQNDDFCFTSIGAGNIRARRFLERGVDGLPRYNLLGELVTMMVAVPRSPRRVTLGATPVRRTEMHDVARFLNQAALRHHLAALWNADMLLSLAGNGLPLERIQLVKTGEEIVACGGLWDQRGFRQTVIKRHSPVVGALRPFVNLASRFRGNAGLPAIGSVLKHAFLSPLAFRPDASHMLPDFIASFFPMAASLGIDFITLALPAADDRIAHLRRRFHPRTWNSLLFEVRWPDQRTQELAPATPIMPDVSLL